MFDDLTHLRKGLVASGRWTPDRKLILVREINRGRLTRAQACAEFDLSTEELASWIGRSQRHGRRGLAVRCLQVAR
jgi:transposase-like protein